MNSNAGRTLLIWFSVAVAAFSAYELFYHLYGAWTVWEAGLGTEHPLNFWDMEYRFWNMMLGAGAFAFAGASMLVWNVRHRKIPATEASFLMWVGLAAAVGFGWQLEVAIAYYPFLPSGGYWPTYLASLAIPTAIGLAMMATSFVKVRRAQVRRLLPRVFRLFVRRRPV